MCHKLDNESRVVPRTGQTFSRSGLWTTGAVHSHRVAKIEKRFLGPRLQNTNKGT